MAYPGSPDSDQQPFTLARMAGPLPRRSRTGLVVALVVAALVLLAGVGIIAYALGTHRAPATSTSQAPAVPVANQVECVNVERVFNAWSDRPGLPGSAADVIALDRVTMGALTNDGTALLTAVTGYNDQPSKELAVAVADYNVALGFVNLELTVTGKIERGENPDKLIAAIGKVREAYGSFRSRTCA